MGSRIKILVQTTIPAITDDWNIDRFWFSSKISSPVREVLAA